MNLVSFLPLSPPSLLQTFSFLIFFIQPTNHQVSHMRGKIADMDAIVKLCEDCGVYLLEDCAHSIGVLWNGKHTVKRGLEWKEGEWGWFGSIATMF